jgi:hypothetical protein
MRRWLGSDGEARSSQEPRLNALASELSSFVVCPCVPDSGAVALAAASTKPSCPESIVNICDPGHSSDLLAH